MNPLDEDPIISIVVGLRSRSVITASPTHPQLRLDDVTFIFHNRSELERLIEEAQKLMAAMPDRARATSDDEPKRVDPVAALDAMLPPEPRKLIDVLADYAEAPQHPDSSGIGQAHAPGDAPWTNQES